MKIIIIGAGLAGLGAGIELKKRGIDFQILEAENVPGGLARTDTIKECLFDYTGHFLHVKTEEGFNDLIQQTTAFIKIKKESAVLIDQKIIPYPIQYNLRHLGLEHTKKIINEVSVLENQPRIIPNTLTQFIEGHFGETLFNIFFKPYNEKLWGKLLNELPKDCLGNYFPKIDIKLLLKSCETDVAYQGYNDYFYYPLSGKINSLANALADKVKENIVYNTKIKTINSLKKSCYDVNDNEYIYDHLITSIPLPKLLSMTDPSARTLDYQFTSVKNIRIVIKGKLLHHYHWLYIPDETLPFYRVGFPQNVIKSTCPDGYTSISIESEINNCSLYTDRQIANLVVNYLLKCNLITFEEFFDISSILITPAYTYYTQGQSGSADEFLSTLKRFDITSVGRYGLWKYFSMEEAYLSGKDAAMALPFD